MATNYLKMPENKVIITVAQTGALVTKKMNPAVPEQPDEIAQSAYDCYNEGAAIVHIHARNPDGSTTGSAKIFQKFIIKYVRNATLFFKIQQVVG